MKKLLLFTIVGILGWYFYAFAALDTRDGFSTVDTIDGFSTIGTVDGFDWSTAGVDMSSIELFVSFEGNSTSLDSSGCSGSDPYFDLADHDCTLNLASSAAIEASSAILGSYGGISKNAYDYISLDNDEDSTPDYVGTNGDKGSFSFWLVPRAFDNQQIMEFRRTSTPRDQVRIEKTPSDYLSFEHEQNGTTSDTNTGDHAIKLFTPYFVVAAWDATLSAGSDYVHIKLYDDQGTRLDTQAADTGTYTNISWTSAGTQLLYWGTDSNKVGAFSYDNLIISNDPSFDHTTLMYCEDYNNGSGTNCDGSIDTTDIDIFWRMEGSTFSGTADFMVTGGDTAGTVNGNLAFNTNGYAGNGLDLDDTGTNGNDYITFDISGSLTNPMSTSGVIGFWFYLGTGSSNANLFKYQEDSSNYLIIDMYSTTRLRATHKAVGTSREVGGFNLSTGLSAANWYFVLYYWDAVNEIHGLFVYDSDGEMYAYDEDSESLADWPLDNSGNEYWQFGNLTSDTTIDYYADLLIKSSDPTDFYMILRMREFTSWNSGDPS